MGQQQSAFQGTQSSDATTFAILGTTIDTPSLGVVRGLADNGAPALVVIEKSTGIIQSVQRSGAADAAAALEAEGVQVIRLGPRDYLLPGFVDCHVHCSQWAYMGTGIDKPLMADDGFLAKYAFPAESSLNSQTASPVYRAAIDDMLRNGTVCYVFSIPRPLASDLLSPLTALTIQT